MYKYLFTIFIVSKVKEEWTILGGNDAKEAFFLKETFVGALKWFEKAIGFAAKHFWNQKTKRYRLLDFKLGYLD